MAGRRGYLKDEEGNGKGRRRGQQFSEAVRWCESPHPRNLPRVFQVSQIRECHHNLTAVCQLSPASPEYQPHRALIPITQNITIPPSPRPQPLSLCGPIYGQCQNLQYEQPSQPRFARAPNIAPVAAFQSRPRSTRSTLVEQLMNGPSSLL
ncbi:hypothetical protein C8Q73DRAFT_378191 [Cubamyces lactineus]|nr:hypothetical protein C8Q73DRAFT_378191 [Cubamyces lactineus]